MNPVRKELRRKIMKERKICTVSSIRHQDMSRILVLKSLAILTSIKILNKRKLILISRIKLLQSQ